MSIYQFIQNAEVMRLGGTCSVGVPRSFGYIKAKRHRLMKLDKAYAALWGFSIKHPDSTRTPKARQRSRELRAARIEVSL
jgi:hypothetical protein